MPAKWAGSQTVIMEVYGQETEIIIWLYGGQTLSSTNGCIVAGLSSHYNLHRGTRHRNSCNCSWGTLYRGTPQGDATKNPDMRPCTGNPQQGTHAKEPRKRTSSRRQPPEDHLSGARYSEPHTRDPLQENPARRPSSVENTVDAFKGILHWTPSRGHCIGLHPESATSGHPRGTLQGPPTRGLLQGNPSN
jgi:hypothetical protein